MTALSMMWADGARAICNHLWQSTLFAIVTWLLTLALRRYQARTRYWLWLVASAKFLAPFSLLAAMGGLLWAGHAHEAPSNASMALRQMSQPLMEVTGIGTPIASIAIQPAASRFPIAPLAMVITVVWLVGFLAILASWVVQWRRVLRAMRAAEPMRDGREVEILRRVEETARLSRRMKILCSQDQMEPGVFGVLRPVLLWPAGISQHLNDAQMESVLAHEVCHVRWRDNLTSLVPMLVEAMFWFHPMVWWMEKQLVKERELACDEEVVRLCARPQAYAESILKVCEFCIESPLVCVSGITGADLKKRVVQIMAGRVGLKLGSAGKALLLGVVLMTASAGVVTAGIQPVLLWAQLLHDTGSRPSYEVATIKPVDPMARTGARSATTQFGGRTKWLIESAYNLPFYGDARDERVIGGPSWINSDFYVINGKIPDDLSARMQTMSNSERMTQKRLMQQSLLADRFKLKMHFEMRELPVYELVVAKGGPKLKPAEVIAANSFSSRFTVPSNGSGAQKMEMTEKSDTLDQLAAGLEGLANDIGGRTIVNKTGLDGQYAFTLSWTNQAAAAPENDAPSIFTALEEQLGLKLVPGKGMVEVVVIDSIERPSEN